MHKDDVMMMNKDEEEARQRSPDSLNDTAMQHNSINVRLGVQRLENVYGIKNRKFQYRCASQFMPGLYL